MQHCVVTVVDTTGIQDYIFGSNRLRENVGASELVSRATGRWVWETLSSGRETNVAPDGALIDRTLEDDRLEAELLYAGGGNAVVIFTDAGDAVMWARALSERVLREAPGLALVVAHSKPFAWDANGTDLSGMIADLMGVQLAADKHLRAPSAPLFGMGVTASCQSTGLAAISVDSLDNQRVSREADAKLRANFWAHNRFDKVFSDLLKLGLKLPDDFDQLGRSLGEQSYIAVVHADGNGMGLRFQSVGADKTNREYIRTVRALSEQVNKAGIDALLKTVAALIDRDGKIIAPFKDKDRTYLPFRPIVYGGDDVTIVCDGRLGLALAARYLDEFERATRRLIGEPISAAAGVAIVKTHYPFARAYALAEELVKSTKHQLGREHSALDWHIAGSGLLGDLGQIRRREYTVPAGRLVMRPLRVAADSTTWRNWPAFCTVVEALERENAWAGKNNKIQQLRAVLREGRDQTNQYIRFYRLPGDRLPGYRADHPALRSAGWREEWEHDLAAWGWYDKICGYFDPIEAQDFYLALPQLTTEMTA